MSRISVILGFVYRFVSTEEAGLSIFHRQGGDKDCFIVVRGEGSSNVEQQRQPSLTGSKVHTCDASQER